MYEAFYNLSDDPFRLLPDPRICFPHQSCAKAWAYLRYAVKRGEGVVVVIGPPGSGKTTLAERLLGELNPAKTVSVRLIANDLNATDLLRKLAYSFGLPAEGMDRAMLAHRIERYLIELEHASRRALVIIDEAQTLSHHSLEAMRLLTDLQSRSRAVLQLILLGQEELEGVMCAPGMEQFQHRVIASCRLRTMDLAETKSYLEYRLAHAEWRGDPSINGPAVMAIFRHSKGLPRHVNKICSRLFLHGAAEEKHALTDRDVQAVVSDLREELLAPLGGDGGPAESNSSGIFDSVYDLALVPTTPVGTGRQTNPTREALAALYLAEDPQPMASSEAGGSPPPVNRTRAWRGPYSRAAAHSYCQGQRRPRSLRRRLGYPYRALRDGAKRSLSFIRDEAPTAWEHARALPAHLGPQLQRTSRRIRHLAGDLEARTRALYAKADRRQLTLAAGLVGAALIAVGLVAWESGRMPDLVPGSERVATYLEQPDDLLVEGGFLDDSKRYLVIATRGSDRPGEGSSLDQPLDLDNVESLAAFLIHTQSRPAQIYQDAVLPAYVSGIEGSLSQPFLGSVVSVVAGHFLDRSSHSASSIGIWTLARSDQTVPAHGFSAEPKPVAVPETRVAAVLSQNAGEETPAASSSLEPGQVAPDGEEEIAIIVSHDRQGVLDYIHFLPAPAAGRPSKPVGSVADPTSTTDAVAAGPVDTLPAKDETPAGDERLVVAGVSDGGSEAAMLDAPQAVGAPLPVLAALDAVPAAVESEPDALAPRVERLVALGDAALAKDRLLIPEHNSAFSYYHQALAIDARNPAARNGVAAIVERYARFASNALSEQDYDKAYRYVDRALRVDRDNAMALALRGRIDAAVARAEAVAEAEELAALAAADLARVAAERQRAQAVQNQPPPKKPGAFQRLMQFVEGHSFNVED